MADESGEQSAQQEPAVGIIPEAND